VMAFLRMPTGRDEPKTLGELGVLGVLGAKPLRGGEENRAKGAKDAKVKGMEDEEIAGVVVERAFALDRELRWGLLVDGKGTGQ
jgi:hypothetical protein